MLVARQFSIRRSVANVLHDKGYCVLEAANEKQAAIICNHVCSKLDLIVGDVTPSQVSTWADWRLGLPPILMLTDSRVVSIETHETDADVEYLPLPFTNEEIAGKVYSILNSRMKKSKVLLVDDDEPLRRMVAALLEAAGFEVLEASNGKGAFICARTLKPDVVLTEVVMPEVEGLELIQELLQLNPAIRIVAMSGAHRAGNYLTLARTLGARASLRKPLVAEELVRVLREVAREA